MTLAEKPLYHRVSMDPSARISPAAGIVGDVTVGRDSCILAGAQLRGDEAPIVIEDEVNIQEGTLVHVDCDCPVIVHRRVTVGHGAILHGCEIGENTLVGMGSIVMNGAKIGANSVVAAGALVSQGKEFPENSLIMGMPARVMRTLSDEEVKLLCSDAADLYVQRSAEMLAQGVLAHPRAEAAMQLGA